MGTKRIFIGLAVLILIAVLMRPVFGEEEDRAGEWAEITLAYSRDVTASTFSATLTQDANKVPAKGSESEREGVEGTLRSLAEYLPEREAEDYAALTRDHFQDYRVRTDEKEDYVVGLRVSFSEFQLKKVFRSIWSKATSSGESESGSQSSVSLYVSIPDF